MHLKLLLVSDCDMLSILEVFISEIKHRLSLISILNTHSNKRNFCLSQFATEQNCFNEILLKFAKFAPLKLILNEIRYPIFRSQLEFNTDFNVKYYKNSVFESFFFPFVFSKHLFSAAQKNFSEGLCTKIPKNLKMPKSKFIDPVG